MIHRDVIAFDKLLRFENVSVHTKMKSGRLQNSSCLKHHPRDGLVWTVGLTVKITLRFQICRALC